MSSAPTLLSIVELGGYPDFTDEYRRAGYHVVAVDSMRKALAALKKTSPNVVVAEFNFQSDFRDRTSSLESLMATLQSRHPDARVLVFYDKEYEPQFEQRLRKRWRIDEALAFPVTREDIAACLERIQHG